MAVTGMGVPKNECLGVPGPTVNLLLDSESHTVPESIAVPDTEDEDARAEDTTNSDSMDDHLHSRARVKCWVTCTCLVALVIQANRFCRYGFVQSLEQELGLSGHHLGGVAACYELGLLACLFWLYHCGREVHKPRLCFAGSVVTVVSSLLWALPVLFMDAHRGSHSSTSCRTLCNVTNNVTLMSQSANSEGVLEQMSADADWRQPASIAALVLSQLLLGCGYAPFATVAMVYLEENSEVIFMSTAASLLAVVGSLGPLLGFLLAGLLSEATSYWHLIWGLPPETTRVGSDWMWWVGPQIVALFLAPLSSALLCFPRLLHPSPPSTDITIAISRDSLSDSGSSIQENNNQGIGLQLRLPDHADDRISLRSSGSRFRLTTDMDVSEYYTSSVPVPLKEKYTHVHDGHLASNLVYLLTVVALGCLYYLPGSTGPFLVKYLQVQYNLPLSLANVVAAVTMGLGVVIATVAGGYVAGSLELQITSLARFCLLSLLLALVCLLSAMSVGCPQTHKYHTRTLAYNGLSSAHTHHTRLPLPFCSKSSLRHVQQPVEFNDKPSSVLVQDICDCAANVTGVNLPMPGDNTRFCDAVCVTLIPYAILLFLVCFFVTLSAPPMVTMLIRCVTEQQRFSAMGIQTIFVSIVGHTTGPVVMGVLLDKCCVHHEEGVCVQYDREGLRLALHGPAAVLLLMAVLVLTIIFLILGRSKRAAAMVQPPQPRMRLDSRLEEMPMLEFPRSPSRDRN